MDTSYMSINNDPYPNSVFIGRHTCIHRTAWTKYLKLFRKESYSGVRRALKELWWPRFAQDDLIHKLHIEELEHAIEE